MDAHMSRRRIGSNDALRKALSQIPLGGCSSGVTKGSYLGPERKLEEGTPSLAEIGFKYGECPRKGEDDS